jgi:septin family protein
MKAIQEFMPIIPLLPKADMMTAEEKKGFVDRVIIFIIFDLSSKALKIFPRRGIELFNFDFDIEIPQILAVIGS